MGLLVDGIWHDDWYDTEKSGGRFIRTDSQFRSWVTADGSPGPTGEGGFKAEPGRYHLYTSQSCPWAHRTVIYRKLKGLEDMIGLSIAKSPMAEEGWEFVDEEGLIPDTANGARWMHELYTKSVPDYSGRVTVPVLWDKVRGTIVNNESSEIIRMFDAAFVEAGASGPELYPEEGRDAIDALNERIYETVNNGVYRCGFATTQAAYDEAIDPLFETLDMLEERLATRRYLLGEKITEADWRLFTTLARFDAAYVVNFKCNRRRIVDYPNLWGYTRDLYQQPGIAQTMRIDHIKAGYFGIKRVNPTGIVPIGPELDFTTPHGREALAQAA